jgi:hypothetical protein
MAEGERSLPLYPGQVVEQAAQPVGEQRLLWCPGLPAADTQAVEVIFRHFLGRQPEEVVRGQDRTAEPAEQKSEHQHRTKYQDNKGPPGQKASRLPYKRGEQKVQDRAKNA